MIELGKVQTLTVQRVKEFGVYVGEGVASEASVLLPKKQVPEGAKPGDEISVFIYKDSEDRLIATTGIPKLSVGETAMLPVKEVAKIGAFLDMGLEKDLLLPFREQTHKVRQGESVLVALYVDKSQRLAATMRVYAYMSSESPYKKDDQVTGTIYEINETLGAFVAVDNKYYGLIPKKELFDDYHEGDTVSARVLEVIGDQFSGVLPFTDKAAPEVIKREFQMSKNAFKRAVGHLLKDGKVKITEKTIEILK